MPCNHDDWQRDWERMLQKIARESDRRYIQMAAKEYQLRPPPKPPKKLHVLPKLRPVR